MASADSGAALAASTLADPAPAVAASSVPSVAAATAAASAVVRAPASSSSFASAPSAAPSAPSASASSSSYEHTAAARTLHAIAAALSPTIYFHAHERYLPCSIEHLLSGGLLRDETGAAPSIPNPSQEDLRREFDGRFILEIDPRQHGGQQLGEAPLYYAHQILPSPVAVKGSPSSPNSSSPPSPHPADPPPPEEELTYIILCGFNGAQPFHTRSGGHFTLADFATHPGDIERITVRFVREKPDEAEAAEGDQTPAAATPVAVAAAAAPLASPSSAEPAVPKLRVIGATFEAHGDASYFPAEQLRFSWQSPFSVLAHCALGSHATYNFASHSLGDWIVLAKIAGSATAGDALGVCGCTASTQLKVWQAPSHLLRFVGLDASGEPIGREVWSKFRGRIGGHVTTRLRDGRRFDGAGLPGGLWFQLKSLHWIAKMAGKIQREMTQGDGPHGLGNRKYMQHAQGQRAHH